MNAAAHNVRNSGTNAQTARPSAAPRQVLAFSDKAQADLSSFDRIVVGASIRYGL
jgi:menaquinone-dependent protoporphyrinogen IX oxidase